MHYSYEQSKIQRQDVDQISKLLRRLKIHFPQFGQGYFYLLLREFHFDCCDVIEAIRDNAIPECMNDISKDLDLAGAKALLNLEQQQEKNVEDKLNNKFLETNTSQLLNLPSKTNLNSSSKSESSLSEDDDNEDNLNVDKKIDQSSIDENSISSPWSYHSINQDIQDVSSPLPLKSPSYFSTEHHQHNLKDHEKNDEHSKKYTCTPNVRRRQRIVVSSSASENSSDNDNNESSHQSVINQIKNNQHLELKEQEDFIVQTPSPDTSPKSVTSSNHSNFTPTTRTTPIPFTEHESSVSSYSKFLGHLYPSENVILCKNGEQQQIVSSNNIVCGTPRNLKCLEHSSESPPYMNITDFNAIDSNNTYTEKITDEEEDDDHETSDIKKILHRQSYAIENNSNIHQLSEILDKKSQDYQNNKEKEDEQRCSLFSNSSLYNEDDNDDNDSPIHRSSFIDGLQKTNENNNQINKNIPYSGNTIEQQKQYDSSVIPSYPSIKSPYHDRRPIVLLNKDLDIYYSSKEETQNKNQQFNSTMIKKKLDKASSYNNNNNTDNSDIIYSSTTIPSLDLLDIMKTRKLQSQYLSIDSTSYNQINDTVKICQSTTVSSVYVNALDGYLKLEDELIKKKKKNCQNENELYYLPPTMRCLNNDDEYKKNEKNSPPSLEMAGFIWCPQQRRYFRPVLISEFLCSRHRYLLGPNVYGQLYDYQKIAVSWMFELFKQRRGGILADEMGLGKTVQVSAFLRGLCSSRLATHILIILPLTLISQWKSHLEQWCPQTDVVVFHGSKNERRAATQRYSLTPTSVIVLTTYETFRNSCAELIRVDVEQGCNLPRTELELLGEECALENEIDPSQEAEWRQRMSALTNSDDKFKRPWDVVVLDEAHKIKNARNQSAQALRMVEAHCRILLTGTPVTNSLDDLWSLMDFACPGLLGNHRTFKAEFSDPIKAGSARGASEFAVHRKNQISLELQRLIQPYLLRRTLKETIKQKDDECEEKNDNSCDNEQKTCELLEICPNNDGQNNKTQEEVKVKIGKSVGTLPRKTDVVIWLELTPEQEGIYREILASRHVRDIFKSSSGQHRGFNSMRAVAILLKLCRHPVFLLPQPLQIWRELGTETIKPFNKTPLKMASLSSSSSTKNEGDHIFNDGDDDNNETDLMESMDTSNEPWLKTLLELEQKDLESLRQGSGKIRFLYLALPSLFEANHRCLIFSQSTKMLDLIETVVMAPLKLQYLRIDGSVSQELRQTRLKKFQKRKNIFALLMTTKVGGQGLNLTCADRVIIVDPDWTPANDNQAVARVHRLGQTNEVIVYRLFTAGAIEDHAFRLQTFKQGITKIALEQANQKTYFSEEDMRQIFTLRSKGASETLQILEDVDPEQKKRRQKLIDCARSDIGSEQFDELWDILGGVSDFDELHRELSKSANGVTTIPKEAQESVKSSVQKLRAERYDETQLFDTGFIQKVKQHYIKNREL